MDEDEPKSPWGGGGTCCVANAPFQKSVIDANSRRNGSLSQEINMIVLEDVR